MTAPPPTDAPDPGGHPREAPVGVRAALPGALQRTKQDDVPTLAAAVAFRIFLSLFPGAVAAVAIFSLVGDPATLLGRVEGVVPPAVADLLEERVLAVAETPGAGLLAVAGVLGGLWAASSAAATLMKALSRIYGTTESRGFVTQRLTALALTLALLAALAGLLALVVLGPQLQRLLLPPELLGGLAGPMFAVAQLAAALAILVLLFAFVYWIGPDRPRPEWEWWSPGALIGVLGWLAVSGGFSLYTQTAGDYEATYAGLAGVIITLVWLQLSMLVLLIGAEVNAERRHLEERRTIVEEAAGAGLVEPTTDPLRATPTRPELPLPELRQSRPSGRAAVAAAAGAFAAVAAVVSARLTRRSG